MFVRNFGESERAERPRKSEFSVLEGGNASARPPRVHQGLDRPKLFSRSVSGTIMSMQLVSRIRHPTLEDGPRIAAEVSDVPRRDFGQTVASTGNSSFQPLWCARTHVKLKVKDTNLNKIVIRVNPAI